MTGIENLQQAAVPYIEQYAGVWAMRQREAQALIRAAEQLNLSVHLQTVQIGQSDRLDRLEQRRGGEDFLRSPEGVAVIELSGTLTKQSSSFSGGSSTVEARRSIRAAVRDPDVSSIVLLIDSPGGSAKGTADLADEVRRATESKKVVAFVEDLAASAAYFVASQADEIVANQPEAIVGSLGTLLVVQDLSQMAENEGVKVHVVSTGAFKGMGVPGSEITDEHLAELKREVDFIDQSFRRAVKEGRGLSAEQIETLFDGRVHPASEAQSLGLVDSIETFDALLERLATEPQNPASGRTRGRQESPAELSTSLEEETTEMAESKQSSQQAVVTVQAATIKEIKQHCKGCDPAFIVECQESEWTVTECMTAWADKQQARIAELEQARQEAAEKAAKTAEQTTQRRRGTQSLSSEQNGEFEVDAYGGNPVGEMLRARDEIMRQRSCSMSRAMSILANQNPELLQAAREQSNARAKNQVAA